MQKLEKRTSPRQSLQIPLRFRNVEVGSTEPEFASETTNISRSGLFMCSPLRLKVGVPLAMTLRVPTYLSGSARSVVKCLGRVVHERRLPNGDIGYGIHFERMLDFHQTSVSQPAISSAQTPVSSST
jgi:PilZ domain